MLKQIFGEKTKVVPDWYRVSNPMGYDLNDVTHEAHNSLLGIIALIIEPPVELSYKICEVDIVLVGATIRAQVFQSKANHACLHLGIPEGIELNIKVHAQVLRYIESLVTEA